MNKPLLILLTLFMLSVNANAQSVYTASQSVFDSDAVVGVKSLKMAVTGNLALILNDNYLKKFGVCNDAYLSEITKLPSNGINISYELEFLRKDHKIIHTRVAVGSECDIRGGPCTPLLSYSATPNDCRFDN